MYHYLPLLLKEIGDVLLFANGLPDPPTDLLKNLNDASLFECRRHGQPLCPKVTPPEITRSFANALREYAYPARSRHLTKKIREVVNFHSRTRFADTVDGGGLSVGVRYADSTGERVHSVDHEIAISNALISDLL